MIGQPHPGDRIGARREHGAQPGLRFVDVARSRGVPARAIDEDDLLSCHPAGVAEDARTRDRGANAPSVARHIVDLHVTDVVGIMPAGDEIDERVPVHPGDRIVHRDRDRAAGAPRTSGGVIDVHRAHRALAAERIHGVAAEEQDATTDHLRGCGESSHTSGDRRQRAPRRVALAEGPCPTRDAGPLLRRVHAQHHEQLPSPVHRARGDRVVRDRRREGGHPGHLLVLLRPIRRARAGGAEQEGEDEGSARAVHRPLITPPTHRCRVLRAS